MFRRSVCLSMMLLFAAAPVAAQCLLANPSFELSGAGAVFAGWNQFGTVTSVGDAVHGAVAAGLTGPDAGGWDVSGVWQAFDCVEGESFEAVGHVRQSAAAPLTESCAALLNVEWRDASGGLIDYDSFSVATPDSAVGIWLEFSVTTTAAPAGAVKARCLAGVLQSPGAATPVVHFDLLGFRGGSQSHPDDVQWSDFPSGRAVDFADRSWRVKGPGLYGPGSNLFNNTASGVWVDEDERLHLAMKQIGGDWYSVEVALDESLGYGDYVVTTVGALDMLDPQVVLGLFLWEYAVCYDDAYTWWNAYNEVDIEYSRWGSASADLAQFVAQPYDYSGNLERFDATFGEDELVSHAMRWLPDRIEFRVWRGAADAEDISTQVHAWTYSGPHLPRPERPRLHLNLWNLDGDPAAVQEIVFEDFVFVSADETTAVEDAPRPEFAGRLHPAAPNPFNPAVELRFELARDARADLVVYDLAGARVRTLVDGLLAAGTHRAVWNGRDDAGSPVASGVYLYRLRTDGVAQTRRMTLIR